MTTHSSRPQMHRPPQTVPGSAPGPRNVGAATGIDRRCRDRRWQL